MEYLHPFPKMPIKVLAVLISSLFWIVSSGNLQVRIYPWNFTQLSNTELNWPLGEALQLSCELPDVKQKFRLEWYLPHPKVRQFNITNEKGRSILHIDNVTKADTGRYQCVPQSDYGTDSINWPEVRSAQLMLYVKSSSECNIGFFQCHNLKHHCIANRYVCDGVKDCTDGSDETPEQCGREDWCSGRLRCGDQGRCMDPIHCCDPQVDKNCPIVMDCCEPYINLKRYYFQIGIEQSGQVTKTKHHLFVIVGCIAAFTCILLVVIILMCQFPAEKPCLRPPNFLTRGNHHRRRSNFQPRVPVTMEDLDVYFESLRSVNHSDDHHIRMPLHPPPYSLNHINEPPPPYPGDVDQNPNPVDPNPLNNNEDNNNGDINGNSDLRDQHSERVVAVLRLSPPLRRNPNGCRTMRGGSSLVALNQQNRQQSQSQQPLRGSRSVAALVTNDAARAPRTASRSQRNRGMLQYSAASSESSLTD